jgi:inositol oxygenase
LFFDASQGSNHGIYKPGQGLSSAKASFGHDEYLYQLLRFNNVDLPEEAYYMIRFHSLYPWHKENAYDWLEDETDRKMKWWVRNFNKYDLYTKAPRKVDEVKAKKYYGELIKKYFKDEIVW